MDIRARAMYAKLSFDRHKKYSDDVDAPGVTELDDADAEAVHCLTYMGVQHGSEDINAKFVNAFKWLNDNGLAQMGKPLNIAIGDSAHATRIYNNTLAKARARHYRPSTQPTEFSLDDVHDALTISNLHKGSALGLEDLLGAVAMVNQSRNEGECFPFTDNGLIRAIKYLWAVDYPRLVLGRQGDFAMGKLGTGDDVDDGETIDDSNTIDDDETADDNKTVSNNETVHDNKTIDAKKTVGCCATRNEATQTEQKSGREI